METKQKRTGTSGGKTAKSAPRRPASAGRKPVESPTKKGTVTKRPSSSQKITRQAKSAPTRRKPAASRRPAVQSKPATQPKPTPDVVYTPAKPFNRNRLLLRLTTVIAVVLALTFGISIFFKVDTVTVTGNQKYSAWTVMEKSGIQKGDNLLTFGKAKASGRITAALPYVESVRIGIKLPDTVNIEIKELDVAYAVQDGAEDWWLITSEGRVVEKVEAGIAAEYMQVLGVCLQSPVSGQSAIALEPQEQTTPTDESTQETLVTVPVTVTAADRLTAALSILQYLEAEELFDDVVSVDVTSLGNIQLWYGQQYQVMLGDASQLSYKISLMNGAIHGQNGLKEYDSGILDITFTTSQGEVVIYEPFD